MSVINSDMHWIFLIIRVLRTNFFNNSDMLISFSSSLAKLLESLLVFSLVQERFVPCRIHQWTLVFERQTISDLQTWGSQGALLRHGKYTCDLLFQLSTEELNERQRAEWTTPLFEISSFRRDELVHGWTDLQSWIGFGQFEAKTSNSI